MIAKLLLNLVPEWALEYKEFWESIRNRNLWFIKLRYGVVVLLTIFLLLSVTILKIQFSDFQLKVISSTTLIILFYNVILHKIRKRISKDPYSVNPLLLSLLQMFLDFLSLSVLVYFTGGIESPLYMLFVFHIIIGSLILPGTVVYAFALIFISLFTTGIILEHYGIIPHHHVNGLIEFHLYDNTFFVAAYLATFSFMILISVYLTNGVARQLYKRETDLVESLKTISGAEKEKQKYIMGIVHEIKTPIAAVVSYLDLILQKFLGPVNEKVETKLLRAKLRADESIKMINDVLNISKLNLYDNFDVEEIDVGDLLQSVLSRRKSFASSHLINLNFTDHRKRIKILEGDKFLLELAFSNIIGNAIKYGTDGGVVEINIGEEGGYQIIEICDDGIGIPENEIAKIFDEFYRASNIDKSATEGSGLGLSVVKKIIERHKGFIQITSPSRLEKQYQPGTCVVVKLPLSEKGSALRFSLKNELSEAI